MKNTYKFILHVVNNLFPINEYSDAEINRLMEKFKEEADDYNITISDEQLKKYIERFDQLKNSPKVQEKDLRKWSLSNLIKLVTSSEGAEAKEEHDKTPDIVYDENGYVVWNGSKEGNCITYGAGERWCITRGSFGNYRYNESKGYPTFYLVKNENLSSSDKLSFVAIQVRDVDSENQRYVYTNRQNSPYESDPMSFSELTSEVPWLNNIPNIRSLLKYIPLSSSERLTQKYKNSPISIRQWVNMPFGEKKQYLVVRKNSTIFDDISNTEFTANYLPKYPQIATFIAVTPGILPSELLLKNLDKFSNNDRKSITANLHNLISIKELRKEYFPFDVKKLLTVLNKWDIANNERIYVTKNGEAIVKLTFESGDVKVGVFTAENDYPDIKLNKRTSKFLLDYPELDKIPFNSLLKLANGEIIDKDIIDKVLQSAETNPDSAIVVKDTENGKIILDSNTFTSYKVEGDKIVSIPFDDEEVQNILSSEESNTGFQESAVDLVFNKNKKNLPPQIEKDSFLNILKSTPYDKRTKGGMVAIPFNNGIIVFPTDSGSTQFNNSMFRYGMGNNSWNEFNDYMGTVTTDMYKAYFDYLRSKNIKYTDQQLVLLLQDVDKKEFIAALPPMVDNSMYKPATDGETSYLVNVQNPRESKMISGLRKIIKANLSPAQAQRLLGTTVQAPAAGAQEPPAQAPAAAQAGAPRRGRPAGVPGVARPAAAPVAGGTSTSELMTARGLSTAWNGLPTSVRNRLASSVREDGISRGASRRNNQLGNRGRVVSTWNAGPSSIYFISLTGQPNGTAIASINIQPGNGNYILIPGREPIRLNSPTELLSALQARNLAEILIAEFMASNPTKLNETKKILNYYIKSKNRKK